MLVLLVALVGVSGHALWSWMSGSTALTSTAPGGADSGSGAAPGAGGSAGDGDSGGGEPAAAPAPSPAAAQGDPGPPAETVPVRIQRLTGDLASKSVVASSRGQVFAQNMMYKHTVTAFAADGSVQRTISDKVDLSAFGVEGHPGTSRGAPVEMAFSPDGRIAWVSNYHMYGDGFTPEPSDGCQTGAGSSNSYVYKIDTETLEIVGVVEVGVVPKFVAVTPDGAQVVVTNWCSQDISIIDAATSVVVATVPSTGLHPRGIAISPDSATAYIALMGSDRIVALDLGTHVVRDVATPGKRVRHLLMAPDGTTLYATLASENAVVAIDVASGETVRRVTVGAEPRSMTMSPDGGALYVANYNASTMSKVRTSDLTVTGTYTVDGLPIGITYEPTLQRVWVASYSGSITVFDDSRLKG